MNEPSGLDWWEYSELAIAAMVAALARGVNWTNPKTGAFSWQLMIQSVATAGTIAIGAAAAQQKWNFPVPITAFVAVVASLVGIPFFVAAFTAIADAAVKWFIAIRFPGVPNAKPTDGNPSDKP